MLGEESVVAMMLQMDNCCSFNLPIHNVVFNRIREVDLDVDDRGLCGYASRKRSQAVASRPRLILNNDSDCQPSIRYLAQQVVAHTSSHTCAKDPGGCDRAPVTYTPLAKGH